MSSAEKVYKGYTRAELETQYDTENSVADLGVYQRRFGEETARVRALLPHHLDIPYGPDEQELLDIYPAPTPGAPIHIFIHGGGWRSSSKNGRGFPAESFVNAGATFIAIDYPFAPRVDMDRIVAAARRAMAWVWQHAAEYNGDPDQIHVSGNSSGGHLTAMLLAPGWHDDFGVPADIIKSITGISGLYDLQPHTFLDVRAYLHLDALQAARNSPVHQPPERPVPVTLAVGGAEAPEFFRQARDYQRTLAEAGIEANWLVLGKHDHFSVMEELNRPQNELLRCVFQQMGLSDQQHQQTHIKRTADDPANVTTAPRGNQS